MLVIVAACVLAWQSHARQELDEAFQRVARRFDGRFQPSGFANRPSVRFSHRGVHALLDLFSTGGKHPTHFTQLQLGWTVRQLRFEIFPETFFSSFGKLIGMQDIEIGSPRFDRRYIIRANDSRRISDLLSPAVQARIESLRQFRGIDDIYIRARAGTLLIKKREFIREAALLERFVALGLEFYDQLLGAGTEGIEFVESQGVLRDPASAEIICQVCGEPINSDAVYCKSCKTPHHEECWRYFGACSTYGCGQKKYVRPRRRPRAAR